MSNSHPGIKSLEGNSGPRKGDRAALVSTVSAILAAASAANAVAAASDKDDVDAGALAEIVVTAQKQTENLQNVPLSIEALSTQKLEQLHIANLDDYVKYLPSVSVQKFSFGAGNNGQPGTTHMYVRGVMNGANENHSASQPTVATYLDEESVTTIDGALDVHIYDIERVELLSGPQGTLYGASSMAGTVRIITNKPDPSKFDAGYDIGGNVVDQGGKGYSLEGFVNIPITDNAAVRLVGWDIHDPGFIDNVAGTNPQGCIQNGVRTFPTWSGQALGPAPHPPFYTCAATPAPIGAGAISNAAYLKNDYNTVRTTGGRGALKINVGESWTVTPTVMAQRINSNGFFGYDPIVGYNKVTHFGPEESDDSFSQMALTVEGKISNFDVTYAGAYLRRDSHSVADYADYGLFYDKVWGSGSYWTDNAGKPIMPQQLIYDTNHFSKWSHELRVSTPREYPVKGIFGVFAQRQVHDVVQNYVLPGYNGDGLSDALSVPGWKNTLWLTDQQRVDRDQAAFGELTWDVTKQWSLTGGIRFFHARNTLQGYYGFSNNYQNLTGYGSGMKLCGPVGGPPSETYEPFKGAPCTDLNAVPGAGYVDETGHTPRVNLTYRIDTDKMVYATYSEGFRPGGSNRSIDPNTGKPYGPYQADYLKNYEIGWKTSWAGNAVRWNGAIFQEDWNNMQYAFHGLNAPTIILNAGSAQIRGLETDLQWAATRSLLISGNATWLFKHELTSDYCGLTDPKTGLPLTSCNGVQTAKINDGGIDNGPWYGPLAAAGTTLPVSPGFKGNIVARYSFGLGDWNGHVQLGEVYQSRVRSALRQIDYDRLGEIPAYGLLDVSSGIEKNGLSMQIFVANALDKHADVTRFAACQPTYCSQNYAIPVQPRTLSLKVAQRF